MTTVPRVRLRPWQQADLPALLRWRNDVPLQEQLMARPRPNTQEQVVRWLEDRTARSDMAFYVVAALADDAPLGYVQVADLDLVDGTGELGICLGPEAQGRGYADEAIRLLAAELRPRGLRKLTLRVRDDNERAIAFYRRTGWRDVGVYHRHFAVPGGHRDVLLMERFFSP